MTTEAGPWSRLIEEHRQNLARLEAAAPEPPPSWALPLGFLAPWLPIVAAIAWRDPYLLGLFVLCFAALVPLGLACLFIERLQPFTTGLVFGIGASLFTAQALFL